MTEEIKDLPTSPGDMEPMQYDAECEFIRNALYELSSMADEVEIHFESADDECECDDSEGQWSVRAWRGGKTFTGKHQRIANALWYVTEHLTAKDRTDFENRERKRKEALAKLTAEEKRILYLND